MIVQINDYNLINPYNQNNQNNNNNQYIKVLILQIMKDSVMESFRSFIDIFYVIPIDKYWGKTKNIVKNWEEIGAFFLLSQNDTLSQ